MLSRGNIIISWPITNCVTCFIKVHCVSLCIMYCCQTICLTSCWSRAGVEGVRVKVFSTSMDTPGRAELMGGLCVCFESGLRNNISFIFCNRYTKLCRLSKLPCVLTFLDCRSNTSANQMRLWWLSPISGNGVARTSSFVWAPRFTLPIRVCYCV